jgi:hypothetical protein
VSTRLHGNLRYAFEHAFAFEPLNPRLHMNLPLHLIPRLGTAAVQIDDFFTVVLKL